MKILGMNIFAHRRRRPAQTIQETRDLIERFLNDCPSYYFEWDDFVSWENVNSTIEAVRKKLEVVGGLLISNNSIEWQNAISIFRENVTYLDAFISKHSA